MRDVVQDILVLSEVCMQCLIILPPSFLILYLAKNLNYPDPLFVYFSESFLFTPYDRLIYLSAFDNLSVSQISSPKDLPIWVCIINFTSFDHSFKSNWLMPTKLA